MSAFNLRKGARMRATTGFALLCVCLVAATPIRAEAPYHHMHLTATSAAEGAAWYAEHMGGELVGEGRVMFGSVVFVFFEKEAGFEGSEGSSVDHIGFSFPDLESRMSALEAAGTKMVAPVRDVAGKFKFAFVEDPWGTRIEVMEDPELYGFHHIHLKAPDPEAHFAWYQEQFGGERTQFKGMLDALRYGDLWLLVQKSDEVMAGTRGRAIDHLSWSFADLDAAAEELKARGVKFTLEPRPFRDLKIAFIEGPDGVSIELVQPAAE
jgi:predicted enzyme related to lactoylglutathione lyase